MTTVGFVTKNEFETNPVLSQKYGTYEQYMKKLQATSIHTFDAKQSFIEGYSQRVQKHNEISEQLIQRYKALEGVFQQTKKQSNEKIGQLMTNYNVGSKKELSQALQGSLFDSSVYASATKSTDNARIEYEAALSTALSFTHQTIV